jgi:hypothetical protein
MQVDCICILIAFVVQDGLWMQVFLLRVVEKEGKHCFFSASGSTAKEEMVWWGLFGSREQE